jgi:hypothetical protein
MQRGHGSARERDRCGFAHGALRVGELHNRTWPAQRGAHPRINGIIRIGASHLLTRLTIPQTLLVSADEVIE